MDGLEEDRVANAPKMRLLMPTCRLQQRLLLQSLETSSLKTGVVGDWRERVVVRAPAWLRTRSKRLPAPSACDRFSAGSSAMSSAIRGDAREAALKLTAEREGSRGDGDGDGAGGRKRES